MLDHALVHVHHVFFPINSSWKTHGFWMAPGTPSCGLTSTWSPTQHVEHSHLLKWEFPPFGIKNSSPVQMGVSSFHRTNPLLAPHAPTASFRWRSSGSRVCFPLVARHASCVESDRSMSSSLSRSAFNTILFVCFLLLFTSLALSEPRDKMRAFEGFLRKRFDEASPIRLNSVHSVDSFWRYFNESFQAAIYGTDTARYYFPGAVVPTWLQVLGPNYLYGMGRMRECTARLGVPGGPPLHPFG